jgi:hypothetical protein
VAAADLLFFTTDVVTTTGEMDMTAQEEIERLNESIAWYQRELERRDRRIAIREERAQRLGQWMEQAQSLNVALRQQVASLQRQVRVLTSDFWEHAEQHHRDSAPVQPLPIAGRADLMIGMRELPSTAFM